MLIGEFFWCYRFNDIELLEESQQLSRNFPVKDNDSVFGSCDHCVKDFEFARNLMELFNIDFCIVAVPGEIEDFIHFFFKIIA